MALRAQGSRRFQEVLRSASAEAIHIAAAWLARVMRELVSKQCGERGPAGEYRIQSPDGQGHAHEGEPPRMESGKGRDSIGWNALPNGAEVGVVGIGTQNMIGDNYMAGWDSPDGIRGFHHPWLSTWRRYEAEMSKLILMHMRTKTGAK